jgi:predicted RNA methylase
MRNVARLKMGYYPLPEREGLKLRSLLSYDQRASVIDPCVGQGTALQLVTKEAPVGLYGVELDAERARIASSRGIETVQGNIFDAIARAESFSLLYLNPPYDSEIGSIANRRMEAVFLEHTYRWLMMEGVLILVIPFERLHDCAGVLSSHFAVLNVFRMTDPDSVQYRQIAVLGVRREVRGYAVENNKRQLQSIGLYGSLQKLLELEPAACAPYAVPGSAEVEMSYRGLPYDLLEDLLPNSGAWRQVAPLLLPHDDIATGRPITPLHGGHVGFPSRS